MTELQMYSTNAEYSVGYPAKWQDNNLGRGHKNYLFKMPICY